MIVVSIIGILASVAIPSFFKYLQDSRRAEVPILLDSLVRDEIVYYVAPKTTSSGATKTPCFVNASVYPTPFAMDGSKSVSWGAGTPAFTLLGFAPSSPVRYSYMADITYEPFDPGRGFIFAVCDAAGAPYGSSDFMAVSGVGEVKYIGGVGDWQFFTRALTVKNGSPGATDMVGPIEVHEPF